MNNGDLSKNSNLLVNVPTKEKDLSEKKNINSDAANASSPLNTVVTANAANTGTIGRNGTLCKKVYL